MLGAPLAGLPPAAPALYRRRMTQPAAPMALRPVSAVPRRMQDRVPAQALLEQVLRARAAERPRTRLERLVGVDPIGPDALSWYAGALGERAVAGRLAGLPAGWRVFHSLPVGRGGADIDHLVVGPGGVFTIDTKHQRDASVWVAGHAVLVAGRRQPYVQKAEAQARRIDRIVGAVLPAAPAVQPVIAVVGAKRLAVRRQPRTARVLRAEQLVRFLGAQPERLSPGEVAALAARFDDVRTWQPTVEAGPELLLAFAGLARDVRRAARIRRTWVSTLLGLTATGSAALLTPALVTLLG